MTKRSFSDTLEVCWLMFENLLLIHWSSIESEAKVDFRCVEYEEKIGFVAWLHSIANTGMIEWSRTETYFYFTLTTPKIICIYSRYKAWRVDQKYVFEPSHGANKKLYEGGPFWSTSRRAPCHMDHVMARKHIFDPLVMPCIWSKCRFSV